MESTSGSEGSDHNDGATSVSKGAQADNNNAAESTSGSGVSDHNDGATSASKDAQADNNSAAESTSGSGVSDHNDGATSASKDAQADNNSAAESTSGSGVSDHNDGANKNTLSPTKISLKGNTAEKIKPKKEQKKFVSIELQNTYASLSETISQQWQAMDLAGYRLTGLFERRCEVRDGQSCIQGGVSGRESKDAKGSSIHLTFTKSLARGAYLGVVLDRSLDNGVSKRLDKQNIVPAMAFYAGWNQNDESGWRVMTGVGYMKDRLNIKRAYKIDTEEGRGHANLKGLSFIAHTGYVFKTGQNLKLNPYAEFRYSDFKRNGYSEDTHFKTQYDALETRKSVARVGVNLNRQLDPVFSVGLGRGVDLMLSQKAKGGSSTMPELKNLRVRDTIAVPAFKAKDVSGFGNAQIQASLKNNVDIVLSGAVYRNAQREISLTFSKRW